MQISGIQAQSSGMSTVVVFILIRQMKSSLYNNPALVTMRKLGYHRNLLTLSSAVGVQHTPFVDQITGLFLWHCLILAQCAKKLNKELGFQFGEGVAGCMFTWPQETEYGQEVPLIRGTKVTANYG